jgi:hypothetical protein
VLGVSEKEREREKETGLLLKELVTGSDGWAVLGNWSGQSYGRR